MELRSDSPNGDRAATQHIYLVFDDWSRGLSVRKVDLSSGCDFVGEEEADFVSKKEELPEAFICIETRHEFSKYITAAFGTKIIAAKPCDIPLSMHPNITSSLPIGQVGVGQIVFYDVRSRSHTFGPCPTVDLVNPIFIPIDDSLFVLSSNSFQVLRPPSVDVPCWRGTWSLLQLHPFRDHYVTSYAVHPDGTIFVSAKNAATSSSATYSFDTTRLDSVWKKQGDWELPFIGPAHFVSNLNSWVGIGGVDTAKYICACKVVSGKSDGVPCPLTKVCKEVLFSMESDEFHIGANLVSMGSGFCLVQCVSLNGMDSSYYPPPPPPPLSDVCIFRLVTFSLEYDKNEDLTTGDRYQILYYDVPEATIGNTLVQPVAFWL